jgi:hypothetical protein
MLLGLLTLVRAVLELAEAEVAVGHEGAQAELLGQRERLPVGLFRAGPTRRAPMSGDLRQEPERPAFNPALMVITGRREGALGDIGGVGEPASRQVCLAEPTRHEGESTGTP